MAPPKGGPGVTLVDQIEHGMPAVQPRTGCDPPGGHGKMGGVGGTGCGQNLEGIA